MAKSSAQLPGHSFSCSVPVQSSACCRVCRLLVDNALEYLAGYCSDFDASVCVDYCSATTMSEGDAPVSDRERARRRRDEAARPGETEQQRRQRVSAARRQRADDRDFPSLTVVCACTRRRSIARRQV